jgi:hypothetical protein
MGRYSLTTANLDPSQNAMKLRLELYYSAIQAAVMFFHGYLAHSFTDRSLALFQLL